MRLSSMGAGFHRGQYETQELTDKSFSMVGAELLLLLKSLTTC
jgi:hypothetical protein